MGLIMIYMLAPSRPTRFSEVWLAARAELRGRANDHPEKHPE
jgi:hypothetical protein